jgi:hypothetical protein
MPPIINDELTRPMDGFNEVLAIVINVTDPRTKFGAVVVTVERILVPNNSDAPLMKTAQYPVPKPIQKTIV